MDQESILPVDESIVVIEDAIIKPPATSGEYLRRVRQEALNCAQVVIANIDTEQYHKNVTFKCDQLIDQFYDTHPDLIPSKRNQKLVIDYFVLIRKKIQKIRTTTQIVKKHKRHILPRGSSQDWFVFCFGKPLHPTQILENDNIEKQIPPTQPYLSLLLTFRMPLIIELLGFMPQWIEIDGFDFIKGSWIYSLISLLEKPLTGNALDALRRLVKLLRKIRSELVKIILTNSTTTSTNVLATANSTLGKKQQPLLVPNGCSSHRPCLTIKMEAEQGLICKKKLLDVQTLSKMSKFKLNSSNKSTSSYPPLQGISKKPPNGDDMLLPPLNVLICLIAIYFGQRDQADDPTL